jgi:pyruvate dehydrogenase E1 component beta subunit
MRKLSFAEALGEAILQEMVRDDTVIVQGEDVGRYGGGYYPALKGLWEKFGSERVRDFPISEIAITGTAVGAALTGLRPIVDIMFADFTFVCFDQIVNHMAKLRYMYSGAISLPIVLRGVSGAYSHLAAQHSQSPEAIFAHFPGLIVVTPSSSRTAKGLLKSAIRCNDTVIFFEHKLLYELPPDDVPPEDDYLIPLGKAEIAREGKDITIVANSWQTQLSLQAAEILSKRGVEAEVIDLLTIAPMDKDTILGSVNKTRHLVAVQEAPPVCGVAAEVITSVMESGLSLMSAPKRVTGKHTPIPFSQNLEPAVLPQVEDIIKAAINVLG